MSLKNFGQYTMQSNQAIKQLDHELAFLFALPAEGANQEIKKLRRMSYLLTYSSEAEAIGQASGARTRYTVSKDRLQKAQDADTFSGSQLDSRVILSFNRLRRKIIDAVELSLTLDSSIEEMTERVERVLPQIKKYPVRQRNLVVGPKLKEADQKKEDLPDMSQGFLDDETWDEMLNAYKDDFVPSWRGPDNQFSLKKEGSNFENVYAWELEKEITQDFVYQVRQGQIAAAKENGINDYVWVAIVDDRTDDCCLWRDGLTTAEIEEKLKTERRDDECDVIVPPAHFNCRCVLAPMVEEMPERPESNEKEFDQWLNE